MVRMKFKVFFFFFFAESVVWDSRGALKHTGASVLDLKHTHHETQSRTRLQEDRPRTDSHGDACKRCQPH